MKIGPKYDISRFKKIQEGAFPSLWGFRRSGAPMLNWCTRHVVTYPPFASYGYAATAALAENSFLAHVIMS